MQLTKDIIRIAYSLKICYSFRIILKNTRGITIIALVITIIVLLVLAGITINITFNNGIIKRTSDAEEENRKQTATEIMNFKITTIQIKSYAENEKLPTLQYLANKLCEDEDMEYVLKESKKTAGLEYIDTTAITSIYTKLKEYPYEFEINKSLQLASINGIKIANNETVTVNKAEYEQLRSDVQELKGTIEELKKSNKSTEVDYANAIDISSYTSAENKFTCPENGTLFVSFWGNSGGTKVCYVFISDFPEDYIAFEDNEWGIRENFTTPINAGQTVYFTFENSPYTLQAYFIPYK